MRSIATRVLRRVGRAVEPLLDPGAPDRRLREAAIARRLDGVGVAVNELTGAVEGAVARVAARDTRQIKYLQDAISMLQWSTRRQMTFQKSVVRAAKVAREREVVRDRALRRITQVAKRGGPVLIGPWTGEVGFELLYWAPFVRWAVERFRIDPERVTLLSRGGTASWYGIDGANYLDLLDFCTSEEFRQHTEEAKKQRRLRLFDRQLIRNVLRGMDRRGSVLHPAMMYALYMPYWKQRMSRGWVEQFATFAPIRPPVIEGLALPRNYVALRFYFSKNFPETQENVRLLNALIESLTADTHVVLLGTGVALDEHRDFIIGRSDRVHTVERVLRPETNLAVQTAVIGGAQAFIGTYGGFSYLAPLCGVNTIALYTLRNVYSAFAYHLDFARQVFDAVGGGSLTLVDLAMRPLLWHLAAPSQRLNH